MPAWTITRTDATDVLRAGSAPTTPVAWGQAAAAALDELSNHDGALAGCGITVGAAQALILAGRTRTGELDLLATRAAVERLVLAAASDQILDALMRCP